MMNRKQVAAIIANQVLSPNMELNDMIENYFSNNDKPFTSVMLKAADPESLYNAMLKANYEIEKDEVLAEKSQFGDVQAEIVFQMSSPENIDFYEHNIINNEEVIGGKCPDIEAAGMIVNNIKQRAKGFEKTKAA